MSKWIKAVRVQTAVTNLFDWRASARGQAAMHLWPLLALLEKGINTDKRAEFREQDDRNFWDRYMRLADDVRTYNTDGQFTQEFYIEPLTRQLKPSDYPHRSPSSIRDRTFRNAWHAAEHDQKTEEWQLAKNFAEIFESNVLVKGGMSHRVPVVDLAVFLFRFLEFPDDATAQTLEERFRQVFPFHQADYDRIFVFRNEASDTIFDANAATNQEINDAIRKAIIAPGLPNLSKPSTDSAGVGVSDDDGILLDIKRLLSLGSSGIIFRGAPGTGKTWYVREMAKKLTENPDTDIFQVQFHPSFGYEDFVEGYRPDAESRSGFAITDRIFLDAITRAKAIDTPVVFIIDEINRGDPARALGELLTYIEAGYREQEFQPLLVVRKYRCLGT